jgi:sugar lactone lactonase YvrE
MIVIPGVKEKMNAYNHNFTMASPGKEYSDVDGSTLTEVDLLLENCDEVMVVEVKTQVSIKWVNRHLKRLELLREKERITGMAGKTIYAAVAGIGFDEEARALTVENGMYLIEIEEEKERIKIIPPLKVGTW